MASAWGLSFGSAWGNAWGAISDVLSTPRGLVEFEVDFEPAWRKAVRLRNEAKANFQSTKQRKKAHQIEIRAAKKTLSGESNQVIESSLLQMYIEWLSYQPSIYLISSQSSSENKPVSDYTAFLAMVGQLIHQWHQDEEEAILALLL